MRGITGPISPAAATTRGQSFGRDAARDRASWMSSFFGINGTGKSEERAIPITSEVGRPQWYAEVTGKTAVSGKPSIWDYDITVYESLYASAALDGLSGAKGRGGWEAYNTATQMAAYTIVDEEDAECSDYIGIEPIPTSPQRIPITGYEKVAGESGDPKWRFILGVRNDPIPYLET